MELYKEFGKNILVSLGIFAALTLVLLSVEQWLGIHLMIWSSAPFCVGFAASIIGVGYILTVKNPNNYLGFYGGIVMSTLLGVQFILTHQWDLVILYFCVFIPFLIRSIVVWKAGDEKKEKGLSAQRAIEETGGLKPEWLNRRQLWISLLVAAVIIGGDYVLNTLCIYHDGWSEHILLKLLGAGLICTSTEANYWLIYKKTDAWIWWTAYGIVGVAFYALLPEPNYYLVILNIVFIVVNASALRAWAKITPCHV